MELLKTKLGARLLTVASFVEKGKTLADIGTDHAYLPVYLVTNGICPNAIASDIGEGPLKNAEKIIRKTETEDKIKLLISDGLDAYSKDDADYFIFAGMGGTLICDLLEKTDWIKNDNLTFIFQPMSRSEELIEYLIVNGFEITGEKSCFEAGRCYIVFCAEYTGNKREYPLSFPYTGLLPDEKNDSSIYYLKRQYRLLEKRLKALEKAQAQKDEQEKIKTILSEMKQYII